MCGRPTVPSQNRATEQQEADTVPLFSVTELLSKKIKVVSENIRRICGVCFGSRFVGAKDPFPRESSRLHARINKSIQITCLILKMLRDVFNYTMCMYYSPRRHYTWISLEKCDQFNVSKCVSLSRKYIRWCYFVFFFSVNHFLSEHFQRH